MVIWVHNICYARFVFNKFSFQKKTRGCPKSRIVPFAIVYFGKKYYLTVAKTKHYSNG